MLSIEVLRLELDLQSLRDGYFDVKPTTDLDLTVVIEAVGLGEADSKIKLLVLQLGGWSQRQQPCLRKIFPLGGANIVPRGCGSDQFYVPSVWKWKHRDQKHMERKIVWNETVTMARIRWNDQVRSAWRSWKRIFRSDLEVDIEMADGRRAFCWRT